MQESLILRSFAMTTNALARDVAGGRDAIRGNFAADVQTNT